MHAQSPVSERSQFFYAVFAAFLCFSLNVNDQIDPPIASAAFGRFVRCDGA
jgi:hypothetical protein